MDHNTLTFGHRIPRQISGLQSHVNGYNTEQFSSPSSESPSALHIYRGPPGHHWNSDVFLGAGYARSPSPSARYSSHEGHDQTHAFSFPIQSLSRTPSRGENEHLNYNLRFDRSEIPGSHHPVSLDQYSSWASRTVTLDEPGHEHRAEPNAENATRNSFGWRLRPVSELPDRFRGVFKFGVFNAIQSACFDQVLKADENMVISAPTGSGKTALFDLSIIRMLTSVTDDARYAKCVYVAPTKALCAEKHNEWAAKFGGLGIKCCELTGDTLLLGRGVWGDAKSSHVIVTTAEKWDSLTRNWADHSRILSQVKLFLVDEVHVLNESRGSTLEVIVSRMKARGSNIRFLLISATVPNMEDVAGWIGSRDSIDQPAQAFQFGEEFRPCKLTKFVYGVAKPRGQNDFAYARTLDLHLFSIILQHSTNKPVLVFCSTRKGTLDTARQLAKDYEQAMKGKSKLPWPPPIRIHQKFHDKDLAALASVGIAVHNAGLNSDDRRAVEELFLRKDLRVLVATSTLAVGVNLPAQMVVIKGVKLYQNGEMREYSDLDIMQMMGRAGRPQFDDEGIAIILCEPELEHKYRNLAQGNTTLESSLHQNLAEHLNSEIGLGTISTVGDARDWLRHSFLYRRIQKNPRHYDIGKNENQTWKEKVDDIVMQSILSLRDTELIEYNEGDGKLSSTEYGDVMSKFYIRQTTMRAILDLPSTVTMREILELISISNEVSDVKLRGGEKPMYEKIRRHNDIRFPSKKVVNTSDKILLLIQAILAGLPLNSPEFKSTEGQPYLEAISVFRHATRIVTAVAEVAIINRSGAQLRHALELARCLSAKAWEDRPLVLRQIEHIGEKSVKVLAENGVNTIQKLLQTSPLRIEELLNRRPPFGFEVLAAANEFPRYFLDVKELRSARSKENSPVEVEFTIHCGLFWDDSTPQRVKKPKWGKTEMTTLLVVTSDMIFIDFRRIVTKALKEKKEFTVSAQLTKPSQLINVYIASENYAGITVSRALAPSVAPDHYPTLHTRPLTSIEMDLEGLEDIPDFWDIDLDDDNEILNPHRLDCEKSRAVDKNSFGAQLAKCSPPVKEQAERVPRKRPDGKYECNHACKDKLKCRHYCCQEGLVEPPRATKKRYQDPDAKSVPPSRNAITARSLHNERKKQQTKTMPIVAESQTQYTKRNSTNPQSNVRSIKPSLEPTNRLKKSRKTSKSVPNFDLQLATLKRSRSTSPCESVLIDDCDKLPLVSEVFDQENTKFETDHVKIGGREVPPQKRCRTDVASVLSGPPFHEQPASWDIQQTTEPSSEQLFLSGPDDEDAMDRRDNHSASRALTLHLDDSWPDDAAIDYVSANSLDDIQSAPLQWSEDDGNIRQTPLHDAPCATASESNIRGPNMFTIGSSESYRLSPSRIKGFIQRSRPYVQDQPIIDDSRIDPYGLASGKRKSSITNISVELGDLTDAVDDPLAEFDRWVASGGVEIIPD